MQCKSCFNFVYKNGRVLRTVPEEIKRLVNQPRSLVPIKWFLDANITQKHDKGSLFSALKLVHGWMTWCNVLLY